MHKVKEHIGKLEELQTKMLCHLATLPIENCETAKEEAYYFADIVKDLGEAMKGEAEAAYYKCIAEEMHEFKEQKECLLKMGIPTEEIALMGYDNWRYSSGRFAPKGSGSYRPKSSGYSGEYPMWDEVFDPMMHDGMEKPYGYSGNGSNSGGQGGSGNSGSSGSGRSSGQGGGRGGSSSKGGSSSGSSSGSGRGQSNGNMGYGDGQNDFYNMGDYNQNRETQYGNNYDQYLKSRRHYTETKDKEDREKMNHSAKMHLHEVEESVMDMWNSADPELKKEIKQNMTQLVGKMPI